MSPRARIAALIISTLASCVLWAYRVNPPFMDLPPVSAFSFPVIRYSEADFTFSYDPAIEYISVFDRAINYNCGFFVEEGGSASVSDTSWGAQYAAFWANRGFEPIFSIIFIKHWHFFRIIWQHFEVSTNISFDRRASPFVSPPYLHANSFINMHAIYVAVYHDSHLNVVKNHPRPIRAQSVHGGISRSFCLSDGGAGLDSLANSRLCCQINLSFPGLPQLDSSPYEPKGGDDEAPSKEYQRYIGRFGFAYEFIRPWVGGIVSIGAICIAFAINFLGFRIVDTRPHVGHACLMLSAVIAFMSPLFYFMIVIR